MFRNFKRWIHLSSPEIVYVMLTAMPVTPWTVAQPEPQQDPPAVATTRFPIMSRTGGRSATITCLCRPAISLRASSSWPSSASAAPRYMATSARMSEHKFTISKTRGMM
ncbi:hypothetical protein MRX96_044734 [Rhipicephalus microplus]